MVFNNNSKNLLKVISQLIFIFFFCFSVVLILKKCFVLFFFFGSFLLFYFILIILHTTYDFADVESIKGKQCTLPPSPSLTFQQTSLLIYISTTFPLHLSLPLLRFWQSYNLNIQRTWYWQEGRGGDWQNFNKFYIFTTFLNLAFMQGLNFYTLGKWIEIL